MAAFALPRTCCWPPLRPEFLLARPNLCTLQLRQRKILLVVRATSEKQEQVKELLEEELNQDNDGYGGNGDDDEDGNDREGAPNWVSNAPVYVLWAGLAAYAFLGAPNQTPYRDQLFLQKLLLINGDEFALNPLLVTVWFSMGLLPLMYSMLLIPTGRSAKGGVPVWPFAITSFFVGIFGVLPYFGLWTPPPPRVPKQDLSKWPLVVFESRIFAGFVTLSAIGLAAKGALCSGEIWLDYFHFFRESRFIHVMTIDFTLLNLLVVFWVFNDLSLRKRSRGSWLPLVSLVPLIGPAIYLLLRPPLPPEMIASDDQEEM